MFYRIGLKAGKYKTEENYEQLSNFAKAKKKKIKKINILEYIFLKIPSWIFTIIILVFFLFTLPFWWINEKIDKNITFFRN